MLMAVLLMASCLNSNNGDSGTYYSDTAIIDFTLGTLNKYVHTTSSTGADSVYKEKITGSNYKLSIDQENHRIFNADSLPIGTDVEHVVGSVSSLNNGVVFYKSLISDSLFLFSSEDSLDYSTPRSFRVFSSDGSTYEEYTVQLNVHKEEGEQFVWTRHSNNDDIAALEAMKAVTIDDRLYVYGVKAGKTLGYTTTDGESWTPLTELDDENAYRNLFPLDGELFTLVNGDLARSEDGITWNVAMENVPIKQLIASSKIELYGLSEDGKIMASRVGDPWEEDKLDEDASWLPTEEIVSVCLPVKMTYYTDYVIIAGISPEFVDIASVWRKIVEYDLQGLEDKWIYMSRSDNNRFALPQLKNPVMIAYDGSILAWGVKDGEFSPIYQSRDNGLIWKKQSTYNLPANFNISTLSFTAATDGSEIWLVSGESGEVWQGHLNRLTWKENK